ncbi:MAG TPA: SDR family oxidoreductase [Solirubrobacterales bacterium]|jgi:NAD(P)-dependent dehydrogenase (short-subunit alcohol dehydrogenase family)
MRAVLITGASGGIGRACALRLARNGFRVFAGYRREADAAGLAAQATGELEPLQIDVTDAAQIASAAGEVEEEVGSAGLWSLVNNAGVPVPGPVESLPIDDFRRQLEVNLVGQVAVTQALLPALRRARGRVVNMTSVGGRVATPFMGAYHASKFGLEGLSDAMRRELAGVGVDVCAIEPGSIATDIWDRGRENAGGVVTGMSAEARDAYGDDLRAALETATRTGERGMEPDRVARTVERVLTVRRPRPRYIVGADARAMIAAQAVLPARTFDWLILRAMGLRRRRGRLRG